MLTEMLRVTQPNGVIRLTEANIIQGNSPMFMKSSEIALRSLYRGGYFFEQEATGVTAHLAPLLTQYGVQNVHTRRYSFEYKGGTPEGEMFHEDWMHAMKTTRPFVQKWGGVPADYDDLCKQVDAEMQQDTFRATMNILTVWGTKPR